MDFVILLLAHWIGDHLMQNKAMLPEAPIKMKWMVAHVLLYGTILSSASLLLFSWQIVLGFVVVNSVLHFLIDMLSSRLLYRLRDRPQVFYVVLGLEQFLHITCLYWTFINADVLAL